MANDLKTRPSIDYTSREYNTIREDLLDHARRYYPLTFKDFSSNSFGALMVDTVAYVGDQLSFYLDYQANECFFDTAIEYNNVLRIAQQLGYNHTFNPVAEGIASFYILVPAKSNGIGVEEKYIPILKRNSTTVASVTGVNFILDQDVDFSLTNNEVVVGKVDAQTGIPTHYAIKAQGRVVSGELAVEEFTIEDAERFLTLTLNGTDITDIISVTDSEGHEWTEVDYLAQDAVNLFIPNTSSDRKEAPYVLKPFKAPRRFIVRKNSTNSVQIIFGNGSDSDIEGSNFLDPSNVVLDLHGKKHIKDDAFDPNKLLKSNKLGVAPSSTTLTVVYRKNSISNVNTAARSITKLTNTKFDFPFLLEGQALSRGLIADVISSAQVLNDSPILGDVRIPSADELRHRAQSHFAAQNRAVTVEDYKALLYKMSGQFGAIKRCHITQDADSFKRNLNIYVVSESEIGTLTTTPTTIKRNARTWINHYKMINDTIDILDARIVNLGIDFELFTRSDSNKMAVLEQAMTILANFYRGQYFDIGEDFKITDVYKILNAAPGVVDTTKVRISRKTGLEYSSTYMDIENQRTADGRAILCPSNVIFEVKFPRQDIKGTAK
jgi:hypothetical protein